MSQIHSRSIILLLMMTVNFIGCSHFNQSNSRTLASDNDEEAIIGSFESTETITTDDGVEINITDEDTRFVAALSGEVPALDGPAEIPPVSSLEGDDQATGTGVGESENSSEGTTEEAPENPVEGDTPSAPDENPADDEAVDSPENTSVDSTSENENTDAPLVIEVDDNVSDDEDILVIDKPEVTKPEVTVDDKIAELSDKIVAETIAGAVKEIEGEMAKASGEPEGKAGVSTISQEDFLLLKNEIKELNDRSKLTKVTSKWKERTLQKKISQLEHRLSCIPQVPADVQLPGLQTSMLAPLNQMNLLNQLLTSTLTQLLLSQNGGNSFGVPMTFGPIGANALMMGQQQFQSGPQNVQQGQLPFTPVNPAMMGMGNNQYGAAPVTNIYHYYGPSNGQGRQGPQNFYGPQNFNGPQGLRGPATPFNGGGMSHSGVFQGGRDNSRGFPF